ncbi:TPA: hypothetical protein DIV49_00705 [Candidatus Saccharibacteria bacterium]|nr:hypothetical protein [Candidatus Saccharibacteria bacterium]HRJ91165.1 PsbP-related protein [Candidatus Saccharibacteria bacterium]
MIRKNETGSAHAVVIIVLVLALITALGWIFWQNFIMKKVDTTKTELVVVDKNKNDAGNEENADNKTLSTSIFSFEYPSDWIERSASAVSGLDARVDSANYEANVGMGLKSGAKITVSSTKAVSPFTPPDMAYMTTPKTIQIDGQKAFVYQHSYEGYRYVALVQKAGKEYTITMEHATQEASADEEAAFQLAIDTFKVK